LPSASALVASQRQE